MKNLLELQPLIIDWAKEKDLLREEVAPMQRLKLIEECGELASAILKKDIDKQKDAVGDIFVVLVILNAQLNSDLEFNFDEIDKSVSDSLCDYIQSIIYITDFLFCELSVLNDLGLKLNLDLVECANIAWNEIKDRTGKTVGGTFIKD